MTDHADVVPFVIEDGLVKQGEGVRCATAIEIALVAERDGANRLYESLQKVYLETFARAEAAEARITEVEAERDKAQQHYTVAVQMGHRYLCDCEAAEAEVRRLREALAPFVKNGDVATDEAAIRTYGDGYIFNRIALGPDGEERAWGVKIEDVSLAIAALAAGFRGCRRQHRKGTDMNDQIIYTVFHDDGPIRLTETELCNGYMRMWEALGENEKDAALLGGLLQSMESPQGSLVGAILKRSRAALSEGETA
jgi:hypothetical protein